MSSATDTAFDPFSQEVVADPYPYYERLRRRAAVAWIPAQQLWMVTGYDEAATVLRNPATFSSAVGMEALFSGAVGRNRTDIRSLLGLDMQELRVLIATDPPLHTRLRRLMSRAFTPKAVCDLEPRLRTICRQLVAAMIERSENEAVDLVSELAIPFPVIVIAELLGIPPERREDFRRWSDAMVGALSGDWNPAEAQAHMIELVEFMDRVVDERRRSPGDDLVSRIVAGSDPDEPEPLTPMEIAMFGTLLLVAGNETTTNLIGNAAAAFAAHPAQALRLWEQPELLPAAIEEVLRWDSPVQGLMRATTEHTALGGVDLPAGALVLVSFAAANRDPDHFPDPGRFDIDRRPADHFAFGHGIHFCLGASLARLEARIVGECVREQGVQLLPAGGEERTDSFILRGFTRYPLRRRAERAGNRSRA